MLFLLLSPDDGSLLQVHEMKHGPKDPLDVFFPSHADPVRKGHAALVLDPSERLPSSLAHKLVGRCKASAMAIHVDSAPEMQAQLERQVRRTWEVTLLQVAREIAGLEAEQNVLGWLPQWAHEARGQLGERLAAMQRDGPPRVPLDPEVAAVAGCEIPLQGCRP